MIGTPFIGRTREIEAVDTAVRAAVDGQGSLIVLAGEPGIGKTRLAEELAGKATKKGALVLWGKCWETGGARAFWPWVQLFRSHAGAVDEEELRRALGPARGEVCRIVPEIDPDSPGSPAPTSAPAIEPDHARFALFDAVAGYLGRAGRHRPLVLILDDVHAADLSSLLLLEFVANGLHGHGGAVLVVATHREAELRRRPDAARVIGDLARHATTLPLRGLDDGETRDFLSAAFTVDIGNGALAALRDLTGGNPFLLGEVARVLVAERRLDGIEHPTQAAVLPAHARELIRRRLDLLPADARETLRVASLVGQEFGLRMLQRVCGLEEDGVLDRLRDAIADRLVVATVPEGTRYRFAHALIRETLAEEVNPTDRLALHRTIGEAIESVHGAHVGPYLGSLAHHFVRAAPAGEWERAIRYATAAGEHALRSLAYEEGAMHFQAALEALEFADAPATERRGELLLGLGTCRLKAADLEGARIAFSEVASIARALTRPDLLGRAALGFAPWTSYGRTSDNGARLLEEAVTAQPAADSALKADLLARLAHVLDGAGGRSPRSRVIAISREATAMARRLGHERSLARSLFVARWVDWDPASFADRCAMTAEIRRIAEQLDDRELAVSAASWRVIDCLEQGDPADFDMALRNHAALAAELGQPEHRWWTAVWQAMRAVMEGRSDAEGLVGRAAADWERADPDNAYLVAHVQMTQLLNDRGQVEETLAALEAVFADRREVFEGDPYLPCRRVETLAELGRLDDARREFDRLAADDFTAVDFDMRHAVNLASLGVACAALNDHRRAAVLYERLRPATGRNLVFGPGLISAGPAARYQGLLAATMHRHDVARRHFDEALAASARLGWAPLVARTRCDYAAALLRRGRRQDRDAATRLLDESLAGADRLGMTLLAQRARTLREQCVGSRPGPVEPRPNVWQREGDYWTVVYEGTTSRLRHASGLSYLAELLRVPGREIHALELLAVTGRDPEAMKGGITAELAPRSSSDAGELLDPAARAAYRGRLQEIDTELALAEADNDPGRIERLRAEREALEAELSSAVGLGGRARRAATAAERARLNVTRAIRTAIARLDASDPELGRHLMRRVRTGRFCMYLPDPRVGVAWTIVG